MLSALAFAVFGYLLGSVSSAILICKLLGKADPRSTGSGNPGATNVLRSHGRGPAAATLAGDVLKGVLPVLLAKLLGMSPLVIALAGLGAFLGHLFPVFFGLRGGKGVATYIGVLFGMSLWLGVGFAALWLATAALTRYSSLAALVAAAVTPLVALIGGLPVSMALALGVMAVAIFWRHGENIARLRAGTESRIGQRKT
jgi:acyl phosphate:glycerol-3-phosphate acyltransferase